MNCELTQILRNIAAALARKPSAKSTKPRRKLKKQRRLNITGYVKIDADQPILAQLAGLK